MDLWLNSDASHYNENKSCSGNGDYFHLTKNLEFPIKTGDQLPPFNAPVLINTNKIDAVISLVQEPETGSSFINEKYEVPIGTTLYEMGHKKLPTPIQLNNKYSIGIITDTVVKHESKAMDIKFYCILGRQKQKQFHVHWKEGKHNLSDYLTNHHS